MYNIATFERPFECPFNFYWRENNVEVATVKLMPSKWFWWWASNSYAPFACYSTFDVTYTETTLHLTFQNGIMYLVRSWSRLLSRRSIGITIAYGMDGRGIWNRFPARPRDFFHTPYRPESCISKVLYRLTRHTSFALVQLTHTQVVAPGTNMKMEIFDSKQCSDKSMISLI